MTFEVVLVCVLAWFLVSVPVGLFVGKWLAWGSGSWLLDEWAGDDEERAA